MLAGQAGPCRERTRSTVHALRRSCIHRSPPPAAQSRETESEGFFLRFLFSLEVEEGSYIYTLPQCWYSLPHFASKRTLLGAYTHLLLGFSMPIQGKCRFVAVWTVASCGCLFRTRGTSIPSTETSHRKIFFFCSKTVQYCNIYCCEIAFGQHSTVPQ